MDTRRKWLGWLIVMSAILLVLLGVVARYAGPPNSAFTSSASALAIIAGVSVGVERVLEGFWTVMGQLEGTWWPLSMVGSLVNKKAADLNKDVGPFLDTAIDKVSRIPEQQLLRDKLADLRDRVGELPKYIAGEQLALLPSGAKKTIESVLEVCRDDERLDELTRKAELALDSIADVKSFAESFKDNPGRRIISLYLGAILGLAVAWVLGLDLFQATLELQRAEAVAQSRGLQGSDLFPAWTIAVTGLIIGLGSSPTHEAIKLLTEWKKALKP